VFVVPNDNSFIKKWSYKNKTDVSHISRAGSRGGGQVGILAPGAVGIRALLRL